MEWFVWLLSAIVAFVILLAQVKLFSIDATLKKILEELQERKREETARAIRAGEKQSVVVKGIVIEE